MSTIVLDVGYLNLIMGSLLDLWSDEKIGYGTVRRQFVGELRAYTRQCVAEIRRLRCNQPFLYIYLNVTFVGILSMYLNWEEL